MHPLHRSLAFTALLFAGFVTPLAAQVDIGELRLHVTDTANLDLNAAIVISSEGNRYRKQFLTDNQGTLDIKSLPYGIYLVRIDHPGFASLFKTVEIRSGRGLRCR